MKKITFIFLFFLAGFASAQEPVEELMEEAYKLSQEEKYAKAIGFYTKVIEIEPDNYIALTSRAYALLKSDGEYGFGYSGNKTGNYDSALSDLDKAIEIDLYKSQAHFLRGKLNRYFQKFDLALLDFNRAIACSKDDSELIWALAERGSVYSYLKEYEAAIVDLKKVLKIDAEFTVALNRLGILYLKLKKYKEAKALFEAMVAKEPSDFVSKNNIAFAEMQLGNYEAALQIYAETAKDEPDDALLLNNRGFAKFKTGDLEGGLADVNRSLIFYPDNSYAFRYRAEIFLAKDEKEKACRDLAKAEELGFSLTYGTEVKELQEKHCSGE